MLIIISETHTQKEAAHVDKSKGKMGRSRGGRLRGTQTTEKVWSVTSKFISIFVVIQFAIGFFRHGEITGSTPFFSHLVSVVGFFFLFHSSVQPGGATSCALMSRTWREAWSWTYGICHSLFLCPSVRTRDVICKLPLSITFCYF